MPDYNSSAFVFVTNNSGGNANIILSHRYSTDPTQQKTWNDVPHGKNTPSPLAVGFNTGFIRFGLDYWWIGIQVHDGPHAGNYHSRGSADDPGKECFLQSADDGKTLTFSVDTSTFLITLISGSCTTPMERVSAETAERAKQNERAALAAK